MRITVLLTMIGLCGGVRGRCQHNDEAQLQLARQMTDISAGAESIVQEQAHLAGPAVLAELRSDPDLGPLVRQLDGFVLRVLTRGGHAVVLLCCADGSLALLEDSACSPAVDRDESAAPFRACDFSLDPVAACRRQ